MIDLCRPCRHLSEKLKSIINSPFLEKSILQMIKKNDSKRFQKISHFGSGNSDKKFVGILLKKKILWDDINQKYFKEFDLSRFS